MAGRIVNRISNELPRVKYQQVRFATTRYGKPPGEARNLKQRLEEINYKDPALHFRVDIGFPVITTPKSVLIKDDIRKAMAKADLEKASRKQKLIIDVEKSRKMWHQTLAPSHMRRIAEHYGIFKDLYGEYAYFSPTVPLDITYDFGKDELAKVYTGNIIKPKEAYNVPQVAYEAEPDTLWTLLLTTPDGNFTEGSEYEYCHWFVGNIPGNSVAEGEQLVDYLHPIPPRGIGYCRYIFVLYKQNERIDFSEYKQEQPCLELVKRDWKTFDFYKKHQDHLTPAGLAFFQAEWDRCVQEAYRQKLDMEEPVFEYDFPPPYIKPQTWFPKKEAFNLYMDRYRDPKEINKEYLLKKLKTVHPFKRPDPPLKYPNAHPFVGYIPSWLKVEMQKERLGGGRVAEIK